ncbi:unnamed protein product [Rangifer tarandus platyrhynchus]|uniref:Uncharacterized protein n=1 Tax=Rangifer tarandus platyrhynchus TaxID=3082113 RepID=A0AC59YH99_RANTA
MHNLRTNSRGVGVSTTGAHLCSCRPSWGNPWMALELLPLILLCAFFIFKKSSNNQGLFQGKCCVRKGFFSERELFFRCCQDPFPPPHPPKRVKTFKVAHTKHRYLKRQEGTAAVIELTLGRMEVL